MKTSRGTSLERGTSVSSMQDPTRSSLPTWIMKCLKTLCAMSSGCEIPDGPCIESDGLTKKTIQSNHTPIRSSCRAEDFSFTMDMMRISAVTMGATIQFSGAGIKITARDSGFCPLPAIFECETCQEPEATLLHGISLTTRHSPISKNSFGTNMGPKPGIAAVFWTSPGASLRTDAEQVLPYLARNADSGPRLGGGGGYGADERHS